MNNQKSTTLQKNSPSNDSEYRFVLDYLLQSVHGIIEFPPSVQSKQPHVLPLGDQQVNPGVLGFNGSLSCWHIHGLCGRTFSCEWKTNTFTIYHKELAMTSFQVLWMEDVASPLQWLNTGPDGPAHAPQGVFCGYVLLALPLPSTGIWDWFWDSTAAFLLCVLVILSTSGCFLVISSMKACREK